MKTSSPSSAAGILIALCLVSGATIGIVLGEPSLGLVAGLVTGIALALIGVLLGRRRQAGKPGINPTHGPPK